MAQILTSIALYEILQGHGYSEEEAYRAVSEKMWKFLNPFSMQKLAKKKYFLPLMKKIVPFGFKKGSGYANAPGMLTAYIVCDFGLAVIMITMVWKKIIPLKSTGARILATFCNPIMFPGAVGNLVALLPWPINQLDHGTESFGHALVLMLGLILLKEMARTGEIAK